MKSVALRCPRSQRLLVSRVVAHQALRYLKPTLVSASRHNFSSMVRPLEDDEEDYVKKRPVLTSYIRQQTPSTQKPPVIPKPSSRTGFGHDDEAASHPVIRSQESPSELVYGQETMPITSTLHIVTPEEDVPRGTWPIFRIMDEDGHFRDPARDGFKPETPQTITPPATVAAPSAALDDLEGLKAWLKHQYPFYASEIDLNSLLIPALHEFPDMPTKNKLLRAHRQMLRLREMDSLLQNAQRQGRISFYMTCRGEEAIHMGAASALDPGDVVLAQYREAGVLMWRGFSLEQFCNQCFANNADLGLGRQMPVHYGSRALNYQTISSPLGTQLPQAVGAAYRLKLQGKPNVGVCFFGDGAASAVDFHSALNFAATLNVPVIFVCRNNGFAISTPVTEQYRGDGIVSRAPGYGMAGLRVDGNDLFAVNAALREAKAYALEHSAPILVECMTYRQGHHSTSDDSTRYRSAQEVQTRSIHGDPIVRLNSFLKHAEWMDDSTMHTVRNDEKLAVLRAMEAAEARPKPDLETLFEDVYHLVPPHLQRQEEELLAHVKKYPERYSASKTHH